jgi:hypothetical protein
VVVVGSSVALGRKATNDQGWAFHLGQALEASHGLSLTNVAESGVNTSTCAPQLAAALATHAPRVVILGLSLANERLRVAETAAIAQTIGNSYLLGLANLTRQAEQAGATVVVGGVYPHDEYHSFQTSVLLETDAVLKTSARHPRAFAPPRHLLPAAPAPSSGRSEHLSTVSCAAGGRTSISTSCHGRATPMATG